MELDSATGVVDAYPPPPSLAEVSAVLDELHAVLDRFMDFGAWVGAPTDTSRLAVGRLGSAKARIDAVLVTVAGALRSSVTASGGSVSEVSTMIAQEFGGDRGDAQALVSLGEQLRDAPSTETAFADGGVSREQAAIIARGLKALPGFVTDEAKAAAERELLAAAPDMSLIDLRRRATRMREAFETVHEADAHENDQLVDQERAAWEQTTFWMREHKPGLFKGGFTLPELQAQMLKTMLEGISAPRRFHLESAGAGASGAEKASRPQGAGPRGTGESPRNAAHPGAGGLSGDGGGDLAPPDWAGGGVADGTSSRGGWPRTGAQMDADLDVAEQAEAHGLPMDTAHREGRALAQLCEHLPSDILPGAGGVSAVLTVNFDYETLVHGVRAATLSTGGRLSAGEARRLACNAGLIPQVFDGDSLPLDLGRTKRLFTAHQRRAAENRYGGCAFPGCEKPPGWTEGHHWRQPWAMGGTTNLEDLAPLCASDHRRVHRDDVPIRMRDGVLEFYVTPRGRGAKRWLSNSRYRVGPIAS